jgi:CBS domain-containing protein
LGALGILALFAGNPFLLFIALFVYMGATQEERAVRMRALMRDVPVRYAMTTGFGVAAPWEPIGAVLGRAAQTFQRVFLVIHEDRLAGILTYEAMANAMQQRGPMATVADIMRTDYPMVSPYDSLLQTHEAMAEQDAPVVPVVYMDRVVGLLTAESIGNYFLAASRSPHARAGW